MRNKQKRIYIYIYIYIQVCVCVTVCVYIYNSIIADEPWFITTFLVKLGVFYFMQKHTKTGYINS
jgi:hypothetical protein